MPSGDVASAQARRIMKGPDQPLSRAKICFRTCLTQACREQCRHALRQIKLKAIFWGMWVFLVQISVIQILRPD